MQIFDNKNSHESVLVLVITAYTSLATVKTTVYSEMYSMNFKQVGLECSQWLPHKKKVFSILAIKSLKIFWPL